jgi:putative copper export protein
LDQQKTPRKSSRRHEGEVRPRTRGKKAAVEPHPLIQWRDVLFQYVGFLSSFFMLGAIGFRYGIVRSRIGTRGAARPLGNAAASAACIGLVGVGLGVVSLFEGLLARAESKHLTLGDALSAGGATSLAQVVLLAVLLVAFILASRRISIGWPIVGVAGLAFALRNLLAGRVAGMVNPLHVLGGSLWIGTLFVLVVCGVRQTLRPEVSVADRERDVAEMVRRFSVVGLGGAALLGITGLITGWTHLNPLAALWTTPYGYALIAKLCVVVIVLGLGAWNWRRVGPTLGTEGGARTIRRTASIELALAALVLFITAILVSLPSPKLPGH